MKRVSQVTLAANITRLILPSYDGLEDFGTPPPYGQHQIDKLELPTEAFGFETVDGSHSGPGRKLFILRRSITTDQAHGFLQAV